MPGCAPRSCQVLRRARFRPRPRTLPAGWRRVQDHRRNRGACGDCQDPHAPGLTCTRATALTGAAAGFLPGGLILKARTVLQQHRRSGSARVRAQRSKCVGVKRFGLMQGSNRCREWGIFAKHRAIDRLSGQQYSRGQSNEAFKFPIRPLPGHGSVFVSGRGSV